MINAKARDVVNELITLGYNASALQVLPGDWQVSAKSPSNVTEATAETFATNKGVTLENHQVSTEVTFR